MNELRQKLLAKHDTQLKALWRPLFMEPIVNSGERIAVAVMASADGQIAVERTITAKQFGCLYGKKIGNEAYDLVGLCIEMIEAQSDNGVNFSELSSPFLNMKLAESRPAAVGTIKQAIEIAVHSTSSFHGPEDLFRDEDRTCSKSRWATSVLDEIGKEYAFRSFVRRRVVIKDKIKVTLDFMGNRLAANLAYLRESNPSAIETIVKSTVDLDMVRDLHPDEFKYELLIGVPWADQEARQSDTRISDALATIDNYAKRYSINPIVFGSAGDAVRHIKESARIYKL